MKIRPPFKIHGGKSYLNQWVTDNFPEDFEKLNYIEPFCGAASVLINKEKSPMEVINDLDPGVIVIMKTLRDESSEFIKRLKKIKYSEIVFDREVKKLAIKQFENDMEYAITEFIVRRMSRGGMKKAFGWSDRERGGMPGDVNAWKTIIDLLPVIADRLKDVFIFNKPGVQVIKAFNDENTLIYADPPYVPESRTSPDVYEIEMTTDDHIELATALNNFSGKVILSGYPSTLYKRLYKEWTCVNKKIANHASQAKVKNIKIECIWKNY